MNASKKGEQTGSSGRQKITPFLWFDDQAEEAVNFYTSVFKNSAVTRTNRFDEASAKASGRPAGSVMTVAFKLEGFEFSAINGGPYFKINPSVSFYVTCPQPEEIDELWQKLEKGGRIRMPLDKYPFSDKYGWIEDQYGVSWQLIMGNRQEKIIPCLMFSGPQQNRAEEAMHFYTSVFKMSDITMNAHYEAGQTDIKATVVHGEFRLEGQLFIAMDSGVPMDDVQFNEGVSMVINCADQAEVDYYWDKLTAEGDKSAQQCGWLKDKFGFSWQVVPEILPKLLSDPDPVKIGRVSAALLKMKKLDIGLLQSAYDG